MFERHRLTRAQLAELAAGTCGAAPLEVLRDAELSRQLLLLRHLADAADVADPLIVLDAARDRDPAAADWVITDPMVGAWTAHAVRALHS